MLQFGRQKFAARGALRFGPDLYLSIGRTDLAACEITEEKHRTADGGETPARPRHSAWRPEACASVAKPAPGAWRERRAERRTVRPKRIPKGKLPKRSLKPAGGGMNQNTDSAPAGQQIMVQEVKLLPVPCKLVFCFVLPTCYVAKARAHTVPQSLPFSSSEQRV